MRVLFVLLVLLVVRVILHYMLQHNSKEKPRKFKRDIFNGSPVAKRTKRLLMAAFRLPFAVRISPAAFRCFKGNPRPLLA